MLPLSFHYAVWHEIWPSADFLAKARQRDIKHSQDNGIVEVGGASTLGVIHVAGRLCGRRALSLSQAFALHRWVGWPT